jgi:hypothetical protein
MSSVSSKHGGPQRRQKQSTRVWYSGARSVKRAFDNAVTMSKLGAFTRELLRIYYSAGFERFKTSAQTGEII